MKIALFISEDWYVVSHRLPIIRAAVAAGHDVIVLTHIGEHRSTIEALGARVIHVGLVRSSTNPLAELRTIASIARTLRTETPDVLHCVAFKPILYGALASIWSRDTRIICAIAGLGVLSTGSNSWRLGLLRRILALALKRRAAVVLVQNEQDEQTLAGLGVPPSRFSIIRGSGVDLRTFQRVPEPQDSQVRVLFVGRLLWLKGVEDLVEAARELRSYDPRIQISLAGEPDPHNPQSLTGSDVERISEEGAVELLGRRTDIPDLLSDCHIVVLPSYSEGVPKALLEAAAAGRPAVATDIPGSRDVVKHGVTGLLVPPHDPLALAKAISMLASDANLRDRMGRAARALSEAEFSDREVASRTLELYDRAAKG